MTTLCASCGETVRLLAGRSDCSSCGGEALLVGGEGRYRLEGVVGRGAMGTTYAARRDIDGAAVAIKELLVSRLDSLETQARFEREGATLAQLDHPGVVSFVEQFMAGEGRLAGWYIVSELVTGPTLAEERARRRYDAVEILRIVEELAEVLAYLHARQPPVVHRDLKPSNVIRRERDDRLVLIDFGAVRDAVTSALDDTPSVAGTVGFMAPEQLAGDAVPASDVYALGATAVALAAGRPPLELLDAEHRLRWREAVELPGPLAELVDAALAPHPADRPSAEELARLARDARWAIDAGLPSASVPSRDDALASSDPTALDDFDRSTGAWFGGLGAGALALADLGGVVAGPLPWALVLLGMGAAWAALFFGTNRLGHADATPLLGIAVGVALAGLLFMGLTHDVDHEWVYLVEGLFLVGYAGALGAVGWTLRARGVPAVMLLVAVVISLAMVAPYVMGTLDRALLEDDLGDLLWRGGSLFRGVAHLMVLALVLAGPPVAREEA